MRKRYISTAAVASVLGAGAVGYLLLKDEQKGKLKNMLFMNQEMDEATTMEKSGRPDQLSERDLADIENAKMVSEGSQFGVQYYNELQHEDEIH